MLRNFFPSSCFVFGTINPIMFIIHRISIGIKCYKHNFEDDEWGRGCIGMEIFFLRMLVEASPKFA